MNLDGTRGHGDGHGPTDTFPTWEALFAAWQFELYLWKALHGLLCRVVQSKKGLDGLAELSSDVSKLIASDPRLNIGCAMCHIVSGSTISNLTRVPPFGCFFDLDGSESIRGFLRDLALEYLKQLIFIKYGEE